MHNESGVAYQSPGERLQYINANWDEIVHERGREEAGKLFSDATYDCNMMDAWRAEVAKRRAQLAHMSNNTFGKVIYSYFDRGNLWIEALDGSYDSWLNSRTHKIELWAQREFLRKDPVREPGVSNAMQPFPEPFPADKTDFFLKK